MQSLDVISVNIWQMIVSLLNLIILFLIIKKFLYKPVKKMLNDRKNTIDKQYTDANEAKLKAEEDKKLYEEKLLSAKTEADGVIQSAVITAEAREKEIIALANQKAENILIKAENDAKLTLLKAQESIKQEIIGVGSAFAQKVLEREISDADHKNLIDSFIENIGDGDEQD